MLFRSRSIVRAAVVVSALGASVAFAHAETVMQQCGQQYQAAKAAGTLNGMTWNQFRTDCSAKLKAQPATATQPAPATMPAAATATNPLKPTPAPVAAAPAQTAPPAASTPAPAADAGPGTKPTSGRAAFVARERECGSEWRTNKVTLIAQTPGLTWPKYFSACNTRLKAAGK